MSWSWTLHAAAAVLLVAAGAPKVLRPAETVAAARELGLSRMTPAVARVLGAAEAALGLVALLLGGPLVAGAVAAAYLGFAVLTAVGLTRGARSCGCFVGDQAAPTGLHVVVDLVLAAGAGTAALHGAPGLLDVVPVGGAAAGPLLLAVALDAWLAYLLLTRLPARTATA